MYVLSQRRIMMNLTCSYLKLVYVLAKSVLMMMEVIGLCVLCGVIHQVAPDFALEE